MNSFMLISILDIHLTSQIGFPQYIIELCTLKFESNKIAKLYTYFGISGNSFLALALVNIKTFDQEISFKKEKRISKPINV